MDSARRGRFVSSQRVSTIARCAILLALVAPAATADFELIDDFEGLALGPIHGQGTWVAASATSVVATDPAGGSNQVLAVTTDSTSLFRPAPIASDAVRMTFLRFRFGGQQNYSFGMSNYDHPNQFGEFEVELSMSSATNELRINDDGTYDVLTILAPDVWYSCWILVDNVNDTSQVWLHSRPCGGATPADQLDAGGQTVFDFRSGTTSDLKTFFIKTGGGSGPSGPLYIDDIHYEGSDQLNLANPLTGPVTYCTAKVNSLGCTPVIGFSGAPSASGAGPFDITATQVVSSKNGVFFYGLSGSSGTPFQGGWLCAQPPLKRTPVQSSGGSPPPSDCSGTFVFDFNSWMQGGSDPNLATGVQVNGQYWYRDPASPSTTGLTNAIEFKVCP